MDFRLTSFRGVADPETGLPVEVVESLAGFGLKLVCIVDDEGQGGGWGVYVHDSELLLGRAQAAARTRRE